MQEVWINFAIALFVQLLLFIAHALYEKKLSDAARILGQGILGGIVLGLLFDLVLGKFSGFFSYALGFGLFFLILNAALFYGLFVANTLLMQQARVLHFYIWSMVVAAVSEITNLFVPLWTWKFASVPPIEYVIVLSAGYFGVAILVAAVWHVFFRRRFFFIDNVFK